MKNPRKKAQRGFYAYARGGINFDHNPAFRALGFWIPVLRDLFFILGFLATLYEKS